MNALDHVESGRCLACGCDVTITYSTEWVGHAITTDAVLRHAGLVDVACRWFLDAYLDEVRLRRELLARHVVEGLHRQLAQPLAFLQRPATRDTRSGDA